MSYRRAWLLVEEINKALREPAVAAETGGAHGGGAVVTPVGERLSTLPHHRIAGPRDAAGGEFRAIGKLDSNQRQNGRLDAGQDPDKSDDRALSLVTDEAGSAPSG